MGLSRVGRNDADNVCSGCGKVTTVAYTDMLVGPDWVTLPICQFCGGRRSTYFAVPCDETWGAVTDGAIERYIAAQALHKRASATGAGRRFEKWDGAPKAKIHNAVDGDVEEYLPSLHPTIEAKKNKADRGEQTLPVESDVFSDKVLEALSRAKEKFADRASKKKGSKA